MNPGAGIVHGLTPLMIATAGGRSDVVHVLLQHDVNVNMVNDINGFSALDIAIHERESDIALLLLMWKSH